MGTPFNEPLTKKLIDVTVHDVSPLGEIPREVDIGPPISANAEKRHDDVLDLVHQFKYLDTLNLSASDTLELAHIFSIAESALVLTANAVTVTNLGDANQFQITFDLATTLDITELEIAIYIGKSEVENDQYLLVTPVDLFENLRTDQASAFGDIGADVAIGDGKSIIVDATAVVNQVPSYDELMLVGVLDGTARLLTFVDFEISASSIGEQATLAF
jgi:hypothetical protein